MKNMNCKIDTKLKYLYLQTSVLFFLLCFFCNATAQTLKNSSYQKQQDSIRAILLNRTTNKTIANSVFQELYIRENVKLHNHHLHFNIYLDLHYWDCGAPDLYYHLLSFKLHEKQIDKLPKRLQIIETKYEGEKMYKPKKINFELLASNKTYLIYHCEKYRKTIFIFKTNGKTGMPFYYFQKLTRKTLLTMNVYKIIENSNEDEEAPWHSRQLQEEYDVFL
jgi:hypothetical protein